MAKPRIVLLHATPLAMEPVRQAFATHWPEAETVNLLDDFLSVDRDRDGDLTPAMIERFGALCRYAHMIGADGILATCSAFGPAIGQAARDLPIPVLRPNEAMFEAALATGNRIGMIATFAPSIDSMAAEFREDAVRLGSVATLHSIMVPGAMEALRAGQEDLHNQAIAEKAAELVDVAAIMLAQFSTSRAAPALREMTNVPVMTSPETAVLKMKAIIAGTRAWCPA